MIVDTKPDSDTGAGSHLVRQLGLGSGIAVVVGSMIGSGIFRTPADIATKLPGPLPILIVWVVGGLFALCGALTLSEVGGAYPYSGGLYVYIREAFGRLAGFLYGWSRLLLSPASDGAVALVFSQYALRLIGRHPGQADFNTVSAALAICAIVIVTTANVLGVKFGSGIQNLTTIAKTGGLLTLIVLALTIGLPRAGSHFTPAIPPGSFSISMFGLALVSVLFACDGWMNIACVSGEMLNPRRNLPRAIVLGTLLVVVIYLLANIAYITVFSVSDIAKSPIIAADSMAKLVGSVGVPFIVATVMLSTFGALNAGVFTSPRVYFAMSEDRLFFEPLCRVHPRFKTPYIAVTLSGVLGVSYVLLATALSGARAFNALIDACVIGNLPFYALGVGSIFVFRRREKKRLAAKLNNESELLPDSLKDPLEQGPLETHTHSYAPPVHAPLYPLTPLLFIASVVLLISNSLLNPESRIPSLVILGVMAAGAPVYYGTIARK